MPPKIVIVTDCKYRSSIAVIRALGRAGWQVIAAQAQDDVKAPPPAFFSRFACSRWLAGSAQDPDYPARLLALCREFQSPVLFPVGAVTLNCLAKRQEEFRQAARFLVAPRPVLDALNDKEQVHRRARELGLPVPQEFAGEPDRYPVVVKPHCGEKFGLKAQDRYRVANHAQEYRAAVQALSRYDPKPIVQEKVEGAGFGASLLLDGTGRLISAICHQRVREYPILGGPSACCESVYNEEKVEAAYRLLRSFDFVGLAMVEFKGSRILEVNPRIWGSFPLTEQAGSPFALRYAQAAAGEEVPEYQGQDYQAGVRMRFALNDTLAALSLAKAGRVKEAWAAGLDVFRAKEALGAKDDPGPARAYFRQTLFRGK